jgi:pimeloyl-ACP methyl ester carboxylesterase
MRLSSPVPQLLAAIFLSSLAVGCNSSESRVRGVDALHTTSDQQELWAKWLRQNTEDPQPALLLLHQPGQGRDKHDFDEIFDFLYDAGYNLLVPDLRSHGQSDTAGSPDDLATDPEGYPVDVQAWLEFLNERPAQGESVDADRVGVIGLGTSGNLAAAAVAFGLAECAVAVSPNLDQFNALQAGFPGGVAVGDDDDDDSSGDDDDSAAPESGVVDGVVPHTTRWMAATGDGNAAAEAAVLQAASTAPSDLVEISGPAHGVEVLWESAENKTSIIDWCGDNM